MKLKSYFSGTVEAALDLARRELGEDALLINARPSTPETRHLGAYEIVFGLPPRVAPVTPSFDGGVGRASPPAASLPAGDAAGRPCADQEVRPTTDATLGTGGGQRAIVMLIGPPGVGKTTTLVKLAARYGLATRRRTQVISTDVYRIAAADQLRALASILGIGCDVVETAGALAQALEEHASKDLILIDTPGLSLTE